MQNILQLPRVAKLESHKIFARNSGSLNTYKCLHHKNSIYSGCFIIQKTQIFLKKENF